MTHEKSDIRPRLDLHMFYLSEAEATTSCKNSGDTSPSWGVTNFPIISHTAAPLPPLSVLLARQKNVGNLSSQH